MFYIPRGAKMKMDIYLDFKIVDKNRKKIDAGHMDLGKAIKHLNRMMKEKYNGA